MSGDELGDNPLVAAIAAHDVESGDRATVQETRLAPRMRAAFMRLSPAAARPVSTDRQRETSVQIASNLAVNDDANDMSQPQGAVVAHVPHVASGTPQREPGQWRRNLILLVGSLLVLACDNGTKWWAERALLHRNIEIVARHVELTLAHNPGGAWSVLRTTSENVRRPFFLLVSLGAILFILKLHSRLRRSQRALRWGLVLVLGGALGNVVDRIRSGEVTDFILLHAAYRGRDYQWPIFNVADIAIVMGVGLMAIDMFTSNRSPDRPPPTVAPVDSGAPTDSA